MRLSGENWGWGPLETALGASHRTFNVLSGESLSSLQALSTCGCPGCLSNLERKLVDWSVATPSEVTRSDGGNVYEADESSGVDSVGTINTGTPGTLALGDSINGWVNTPGDDDWYAVTMVAGQSYSFILNSMGAGGDAIDAYLELRNSLGGLIGFDDDFGAGNNALLNWTATETGTYYINARAFEGTTPNDTGSYTLSFVASAPANLLDAIDYHYTMPTTSISIWFATTGYTNPSGDAVTRNWTQPEIEAVMAALATYSAIAPLTFSIAPTQGAATWIFSLALLEGNTLGYFAVGSQYAAFDPTVSGFTAGLTPGGSSWTTVIHEAGHGLGMAHPHDNGAENYGPDNSEVMQGVTDPFTLGTLQLNQGVFTTMSYNDGWQTGGFGSPPSNLVGNQATPMALDIALIQQRYGINPTTGLGNNTYTLANTNSAYRAIWDNGGTDTISYAGSGNATIDLRAATLLNAVGGGGYVSFVQGIHGGWTIANDVVIETATGGSGNDTLIGNDAANTLIGGGGGDTMLGGDGNDFLDGGAAADSMAGGLGDDTYVVDNVGDVVTEASGEGTDYVQSSIDWTLGANLEILTLVGAAITGIGNAVANAIDGTANGNVLQGMGGADRLTGFGGADLLDGGAEGDLMIGGIGDDRYIVDNVGDVTTEFANEGTDNVESSIDWTLHDNIELLYLVGAAIRGTGNAVANAIDGTANGNVLQGMGGGDRLTGFGGADLLDGGADGDLMIGGIGDDRYMVDNIGDVTSELVGEGIDNVEASIDWTLHDNVEILYLAGSAIRGTGNAVANAIDGTANGNVLQGMGGADRLTGFGGADLLDGGAEGDLMIGGIGDDRYIVDNVGDVTSELAGEGVDNVESSIDWTLGANVEILYLAGSAIRGTGNAVANAIDGTAIENILEGMGGNDRLTGYAGNDILDGGAGDDQLIGGLGHDRYFVDSIFDQVIEAFNEGVDQVVASISWTLGANLELLQLTGSAFRGAGNDVNNEIIGTDQNNRFEGFAGDDRLIGLGGDDWLDGWGGSDQMIGGLGSDTYVVDLSGDQVVEDDNAGTDLVYTYINYTLGANVENLTLLGSADVSATGNAADNHIIGNAGANVISGGAGNDILEGGAGDDQFVFVPGSGSDQIIGFSVGGTDDDIDLSAYDGTGITWNITQVGADTVFTFSNGDVITLIGVDSTLLNHPSAFIYG